MDFKQLFDDYRQGKLTAEERAAFEKLLHNPKSEEFLRQLMDESLAFIEPVEAPKTQELVYAKLQEHLQGEKAEATSILSILKRGWIKYAAVLVVAIGAAAFVWVNSRQLESAKVTATQTAAPKDVPPGREGAILTLSDGSQVVLDSLGNGLVAQQNGTQVRLTNGMLAYDHGSNETQTMVYNTMRTPKGRQFQLLLPDGSKVWLNAASSITYPTHFSENERKVEITGEVYFEVVKNAKSPFRVKINEATAVEVLGTSFNVNSYADQAPIQTTLLEGSVLITMNQQAKVLKPGQQAVITPQKNLQVEVADLEQVMAWKNGLFNFNGYDLKAVMKELGRWYDLEIVYEGDMAPVEVMGEMQRNLTLSQVMKILQKLGIKYRIEGNQLIVMQ